MRKIIIDYAHGINIAGKGSPDGRHKEWRWSREILKQVILRLEEAGVPVSISNPSDYEFGLIKRLHIMNSIPAPAFVFSLHNNAAGMGDAWKNARGASIWTTYGRTKSDGYATNIYSTLAERIPEISWRKDITDGDVDYESNFTVLMSIHPSVLLEWGFQDNKEDLELINRDDIEERLVCTLSEILIEIAKQG